MWGLVEEKQAGRAISLHNIMNSSQGSKVEDGRDTVYALLGLWLKLQHRTKLHPLLTPDYSKTPEAVICDATRYMVAIDHNLIHLRFLYHGRHPDPMEKKLPSWAASWHRARDSMRDPLHSLRQFNADGRDSRKRFLPPSDISSGELSLRGKAVGPVRLVTEMIEGNGTPSHVVAILGQLETAWSSSTQQNSELTKPSRLGELLIAGSDHQGDPATEDFSVRGYTEWLKYLRCENSWPGPWRLVDERDTVIPRKVAEYNQAFWSACRNRVLFVTESGRLGVGPQTLKGDDLVVILYGCDLPAILRRCPNSDLHEFIGVAYVEGIMFGEAVEDPEAKEDVTFHLR
ncbi:hypothetical protein KC343_g9449 [Hortaea werneckii]|nr:hypothetical protein KC323_g4586 [Hortaea werneckii]KAI6871942.1 hypothetical protein KC338_g2356 [Hortaea werneckii]KAI7165766.1 hypothetical protein KC352_g26091 [Hortaea werneckii]KAI7357370.1 hypothetical protein KC320_g1791 [Hortaea werneckii]KAI7564598.1 hypothetical protein KC317_g6953 [Hortaea werneckii]